MNRHLWKCGRRSFEIGHRPLIMGVLNITPDSFSDGGRFLDPSAARAQAHRLIADGADILDVGAESSRPGSQPTPDAEQLRRLLPVVETLSDADVTISIDTTRAAVAARCVDAGACIINDITGLRDDPDMRGVVRETGAGVVVMHMQGTPATMQVDPRYDDVIEEIASFFQARLDELATSGIDVEQVCLDPGIGFGKTLAHNLRLLAELERFQQLGRPVCLGVSRKRFIGEITGRDVEERMVGSVAVASVAMARGSAQVIRVHDVAATRDAVMLFDQIERHRICR